MAAETPEAGALGEWRRLSPWSIAHFSAKAVVENIRTTLAFVAGAYGVSVAAFDRRTWIVPAALVLFVLARAVVSYVFYRFRLTADAVLVRSGAFFRKDLRLSFERIQNIHLLQPFYFRPLGLVTLRIDSAGSDAEEVSLAALGRAEADAIRG
ncbi:MAG: PH domain-containing protein, partial [Lysobacterales bacterium]